MKIKSLPVTAKKVKQHKVAAVVMAAVLGLGSLTFAQPAMAAGEENTPVDTSTVVLRVSNWEEYIDLGDWDEEETIDLDSGDIIGENSMVDDFEEWYYETYGIKVKVEYSCFGSNEEFYNTLTLGNVYDLVCPSEYMMMKLYREGLLEEFSDDFFDTEDEYNYYTNGVSPFIESVYEENEIDGVPWNQYFAGYMWGITGIVYNPEKMTAEEASSWKVLTDPKFRRQVTIKDNVRDSYFAAVGAVKADLLTSEEFINDPDYHEKLKAEMNDTSPETLALAQEYLETVKGNAYSFESDSGKADMVTGKVVANYQWSGDATFSLDQAEEDDFILAFAVPEESTNIYFDGWVMMKDGLAEDDRKQHAAEAFINFLSRPDNAIRNMYYIGYTSAISGGDDDRIFEYADWCYGAEEDEEDVVDYDIGYFWGDDSGEEYVITTPEDQLYRQLSSQYPTEEVMERSSIMTYFDDASNAAINNMWIQIRCQNIKEIPAWAWAIGIAVIAVFAIVIISQTRKKTY